MVGHLHLFRCEELNVLEAHLSHCYLFICMECKLLVWPTMSKPDELLQHVICLISALNFLIKKCSVKEHSQFWHQTFLSPFKSFVSPQKIAFIRSYRHMRLNECAYWCIIIYLELILIWKSISLIILPACWYFHIWLQFLLTKDFRSALLGIQKSEVIFYTFSYHRIHWFP